MRDFYFDRYSTDINKFLNELKEKKDINIHGLFSTILKQENYKTLINEIDKLIFFKKINLNEEKLIKEIENELKRKVFEKEKENYNFLKKYFMYYMNLYFILEIKNRKYELIDKIYQKQINKKLDKDFFENFFSRKNLMEIIFNNI